MGEQESKGKKSSDKEREIKVAPKIAKETVSDVLKVQNPEMKKKKSAPTFEQLAADSKKILATIKMTQPTTGSVASKEKAVSDGKSNKDFKETSNVSKFGLT